MNARPAAPRPGASRRLSPQVVSWTALILATAVLAFVPGFAGRYLTFAVYFFLLSATLAQSWNLIGGFTGLVSLGHAAFFGLGAYAAALTVLHLHAPLALAILIGGATAALFAFCISFVTFRLRGVYFTIGTLVLAEALRLWMINWSVTGGAQGLQFPFEGAWPQAAYYWVMLGLAFLSTALVLLILHSPLGVALRAIRDNEDSARTLGVDIFRTKLKVFVLSGFLAGLAGAVHAGRLGAIEPYSIFGADWSISTINIVIIGGLGTVFGPAVGALFNSLSSELLADFSNLHLVIEGVLVIVIIRFLPGGLLGLFRWPWRGRPTRNPALTAGDTGSSAGTNSASGTGAGGPTRETP